MSRCVLGIAASALFWAAACTDQNGFLPPRVVERRLPWESGEPQVGPVPGRGSGSGEAGVGQVTTVKGLVLQPADHWQEAQKGRFRLASYRGAEGVDISVTAFPGDAGGLRGNVDRWRQQLGLPPLQPAELAALPRQRLLGVEAVLVDAAAPDGAKGVFGIVCPPGDRIALRDQTVFVKATGPVTALERERGRVIGFVQRMDRHSGDQRRGAPEAAGLQPHPAPAGETATSGDAPVRRLAWSVPIGWQPVAPGGMRLAAWHPSGDPEVDAYATVLPGRAGSLGSNLALWAQQIEAPVPGTGDQQVLTMLGGRVPLCVLRGPEQATLACAALGLLDGDSLFLKVTGPADKVLGLQAAFAAFCQSVELR